MRLTLFALFAFAAVLPHAASAQSPAQTTPDSGVKNQPAVADDSLPARLLRPKFAPGKRADFEAMVATHAKANDVPESLVHRIIVRESKYQPLLVGRGGTIGLMQIKLGTARALGYSGTAEGLRDANTNMTYAVKYLAGAWRTAKGDANRAVSYYAGGYYYAAKRKDGTLQLVSVKERGRKSASAMPAAPRLDELTDAAAPVGTKD